MDGSKCAFDYKRWRKKSDVNKIALQLNQIKGNILKSFLLNYVVFKMEIIHLFFLSIFFYAK